MRVLFTSTSPSGHIMPLFRYAQAMRARGHDVRIASTEPARDMVEKAGLVLEVVPAASEEDRARVFADLDAANAEQALIIGQVDLFCGIFARAALPGILEIVSSWKPELIIRESGEYAGLIAAQKYGLKSARVSIMATGFHALFDDVIGVALDELRQSVGLTRDQGASLLAEPCFCAFPKSVDSDDASITPAFRVGQHHTPYADRAVPLPDWVPRDGTPLIYITFGTVSGRSEKAQAAYRRALESVSSLPVRALLTTGPVMQTDLLGDIPENVHVMTFVPQEQVFVHASAVVNHGGSGTFLGTLAAGLPQIIVPLFADQPHNARSLQISGAGIGVFDDDPIALRDAMERVQIDEDIQVKAQSVATEIATMPDIETATDALEYLVNDF